MANRVRTPAEKAELALRQAQERYDALVWQRENASTLDERIESARKALEYAQANPDLPPPAEAKAAPSTEDKAKRPGRAA